MTRLVDRLGRAARTVLPLVDEVASLGTSLLDDPHAIASASSVGDGRPVLVIGGLASSTTTLAPLTRSLSRLGYAPVVAPTRHGLDCAERTMPAIERTLARVRHDYGEPPVVVAHSRGGHVARAAARRHPESMRALITLGSPLVQPLAVHPLLRAGVTLLAVTGGVVPGLLGPSCLWGTCCDALREDLLAPFPVEVPFVSVYSRRDSVVDWRSCLDRAARHREVHATHAGLISAAAALDVLAEEIAHCTHATPRPQAVAA